MQLVKKIVFVSFLLLSRLLTQAQDTTAINPPALPKVSLINKNRNVDVSDLINNLLGKDPLSRNDTTQVHSRKMRISAIPTLGYTLQTGFAAVGVANAAFYLSDQPQENASTILTSVSYTQYKQVIFPLQANLWTKNNDYNIVADWRYMYYPSPTYGLGGYTKTSSGYNINYSYLRLHQSILRSVAERLYLGLGYDLDYYWNIREENPPAGVATDFQKYGLKSTSVSSGLAVNILYDTRRNTINASNGIYASIAYRPRYTFMGSDNNWASVQADFRKYIKLSSNSRNVLAIWNYYWFTFGKAPYLMLPSTGWDAFCNTGRGYIQGRYRGKNMLYLESEYRFAITNNGLLGGVVFANAQSFTEPVSHRFETIAPGYGAGIRIKINKFSKTNLAIDYAFGRDGSRGFFVNLGEVF